MSLARWILLVCLSTILVAALASLLPYHDPNAAPCAALGRSLYKADHDTTRNGPFTPAYCVPADGGRAR